MLGARRTRIASRLREQRGFTLIELLVVMVAGIVVVSALFTILDVTLNQTSRTYSTVDASEQTRSTFEQLESELHSACLGADVTPIQTGSSGSTLIFTSQYGSTAGNANSASPTPVLHTITYTPASGNTGTLTDTTTAASGGSAPNWVFNGASTTKTLLANVGLVGGASGTPAFQYFAYQVPMNGAQPYVDAGGNSYEMLIDGINAVPGTSPAVVPAAQPLAVPLSATNAQSAAEVLITLLVRPSGGDNEKTNLAAAAASANDQIVLRLTPPANHAGSGATFSPCQ
jgi:prepilin-type N-terminal cleavage/methylation domain-containing protein